MSQKNLRLSVSITISNTFNAVLVYTAATAPATITLCQGDPVTFRGRNGQSYEFRVGGTVLFRTNAGPSGDATFDPMSDTISGSFGYTLLNNDVVDVVAYDQALTASGTVDPSACSDISESFQINIVVPPAITVSTADFTNIVCDDSPAFVVATNIPSATYTWNLGGVRPLGTTTTNSLPYPH